MERTLPSGSGQKRPLPSTTTPYAVNDHIFVLYKPAEDIEPSMDILFFHGLQFGQSIDAYRSTWTCGSGDASEQIWPSTWLVEEFPNAQIFSMSYDSCIEQTREHGRFDLHNVAENMIQAIIWAGIGQGLRRPVVLVGHCFGGLVMKALCVEAHRTHNLGSPDKEKIERFLQNVGVGGVFFYGTPHHGSPTFDTASFLFSGLLLGYVKVLSKDSARLHQDFVKVSKVYNIERIASIGESLPTSWENGFSEVVVPEASARYGAFITVPTNHIKICKPESKTSNSFQYLTTFLRNVQAWKVQSRFEKKQTPRALVGLDRAVNEFKDLLLMPQNQTVGIFGMGGVGKSTLAKAVFNELGPTFDYSCFIDEVKKIEGKEEDVEKNIWNRLHLGGEKGAAYAEGCWSRLTSKRLLLVLDDLSFDRDLNVLSKIADAIGSGESRFIVTSRDGVRLNNVDHKYQMPFLDYINAKQLFMSYAFPHGAVPSSALERSVEDIVKKCDGLPLTLELMGQYLCNKKDQVWKETLRDLDKANVFSPGDRRLWEQLRSCYNGLEEMEQELFLDATTFFLDTSWTLHEAITAWGSIYASPHRLWQNLLDMSFVYKVKEDEHIRVHEQLQSLGKKIASESTKCRRISWVPLVDTEVLKLLQSTDESDVQQIRSLRLKFDQRIEDILDKRDEHDSSSSNDGDIKVDVSRRGFRSLHTARYLDLQVDLSDTFFDTSPVGVSIQSERPQENQAFPTDQLVLLRCSDEQFDGFPFSPTPFTRLVVLELSPCEHLPRFTGQFLALKILKISASRLRSLPDEIGGLLELEHLALACLFIMKLPESFGKLKKLKSFVCSGEYSVMGRRSYLCLPEGFGDLPALENLEFNAIDLVYLPESFGHLRALKHLEFRYCDELDRLPESFGHLSTLEHLEFDRCSKLASLPESFGCLPALKHLKFLNCQNLASLPESFGCLPALKHLKFLNAQNLAILPESFGRLSTLEHLEFCDCEYLASLPESFGHLSALKHLEFDNCHKLDSLPESLRGLSTLEHLEIHTCWDLASLPMSFGELAKLQDLVISDCASMDRLPNSLAGLKDLRSLVIELIPLSSIPDSIKALPSLQTLELGDLPFVEEFPPWLGEIIPVDFAQLGDLPKVEEFPPWLGELNPVDFPPVSVGVTGTSGRRIFHVRDGYFALAEEKTGATLSNWFILERRFTLSRWFERQARKKSKSLDYRGALAASGKLVELQIPLGTGSTSSDSCRWIEILAQSGILKRLCGDFHGALKDLNTAMDIVHREESGEIFYEYTLRRERGYVWYVLGYVKAAREDGEMAFKYQCSIMDQHVFEYGGKVRKGFMFEIYVERAIYAFKEFVLDLPVLSYLNFEFLGRVEYLEKVNHLHSVHSQAMQKVLRDDFAGALADFDAVDATINARLIGFRAQAYMLQERGILKCFTDDLDGALSDLTSALRVFDDHEFRGGLYSFASGYESRKHRGYVKHLRNDVRGARCDAATAQKLHQSEEHRRYQQDVPIIHWSAGRGPRRPEDKDPSEVEFGHIWLGSDSLEYLGFNLL